MTTILFIYHSIGANLLKQRQCRQLLKKENPQIGFCYHTTKIESNVQLEQNKKYYETVRSAVKKYLKKQFVLLTPLPLRKELINWLYSNTFKKN